MNEEEEAWLDQVEEILAPLGVELDTNNDGWMFMFENGWTPKQAVREMIHGG